MSVNKNNIVRAISLLIFVLSISLTAQEKDENSWKSKVKNIKGDVQKIVISTKSGNTVFENDEAAALLEYLKKGNHKVYQVKIDGDFESSDGSTFVFESDSDDEGEHHFGKNIVWVTDSSDDSLGEEVEKKIKVKIEDGEKIITVTTNKDGKETVKTYTGKEADDFLKSENGKRVKVKIFEGDKFGDAKFFGKGSHKIKGYGNKFWVHSGEDSDGIEKNINVEKKDGKLKVTVTTTDDDGKKEIKVYEGDDAEKYLEENNDGDNEEVFLMEICKDKNKSECSKKIKVKINTEEDKDDD